MVFRKQAGSLTKAPWLAARRLALPLCSGRTISYYVSFGPSVAYAFHMLLFILVKYKWQLVLVSSLLI